jgi:hypothetical protein
MARKNPNPEKPHGTIRGSEPGPESDRRWNNLIDLVLGFEAERKAKREADRKAKRKDRKNDTRKASPKEAA